MAIKLPKDFIESDYRFEVCVPQPVIETEKKPDGSFKLYVKYDASLIDGFVKDMARDMNEKLSAELIDELLRLNGYVPERTVKLKDNGRCPDCDKLIGEGERYCAWCGARVKEVE